MKLLVNRAIHNIHFCLFYVFRLTSFSHIPDNMMRRNSAITLRSTFAATFSSAVTSLRHVASHANAQRPEPLKADDLNRLTFLTEVDKAPETWSNPVGHPVWDVKDVEQVQINHKPSGGIVDTVAYTLVKICRWSFDTLSLYRFGTLTTRKVVNRCLFLETVAGVPGMVGGMVRHMSSLRGMKRDHGWIHTLLEEAENERMHLLTFMQIRKPGFVFRAAILVTQGIMFNALFFLYLLNPRFVHRFVGYLEEEAVMTYSKIIHEIDAGRLTEFNGTGIPDVARNYWRLGPDATFRDMFNVIRADEAGHRLVNHTFADMHERKLQNSTNPFLNRLHGDAAESDPDTAGASAAAAAAPAKPVAAANATSTKQ